MEQLYGFKQTIHSSLWLDWASLVPSNLLTIRLLHLVKKKFPMLGAGVSKGFFWVLLWKFYLCLQDLWWLFSCFTLFKLHSLPKVPIWREPKKPWSQSAHRDPHCLPMDVKSPPLEHAFTVHFIQLMHKWLQFGNFWQGLQRWSCPQKLRVLCRINKDRQVHTYFCLKAYHGKVCRRDIRYSESLKMTVVLGDSTACPWRSWNLG